MAHTDLSIDPNSRNIMFKISLDRNGDEMVFNSIREALKAAGEQFVKDNMDKILDELKTENIERFVAEYVARNLELKIKEK